MKQFSPESLNDVQQLIKHSTIMPVISLSERSLAIPLARTLYDAGLRTFEITLRSSCALDVISDLRQVLPDATIGAGTVLMPVQVKQVKAAGAQFIVTPGISDMLLDTLIESGLATIPGIMSPSELVQGYQRGLRCFKFFPAEQAGGINMLKAFQGPFADVSFCPTGGLTMDNFTDYLTLKNVPIVGGTWLTPSELLERQAWSEISTLIHQTHEKMKGE